MNGIYTITDMAASLIKEDIRPEELELGDLVCWTDGGVQRVGKIEQKKDGIYFYDEWNNGGGPYKDTSWIRIVPRSYLSGATPPLEGSASDLAECLNREEIPAGDVQVGDIMIDGHGNVRLVGKVDNKGGEVFIWDVDNNGGGPESSTVEIIPRDYIADQPYY